MLLESKKWAIGYYRVGKSWVALLRAPRFGMIHLGHYTWWKPLAMLPVAFVAHVRLLLKS